MNPKKNNGHPIKIAILGTRGIPANYGGFETFAEEISSRLVQKGLQVTVYCRKGKSIFREPYFKGVRRIELPTLKHKYFDTLAHTFLSTIHVLFTDTQIVYYCNAINSIFMILPRLAGKKVVINVDGLEWKRSKWNKLGKMAYQVSEWLATFLAHIIISDSKRIAVYYKKKFDKETVLIPYGTLGEVVEDGHDFLAQHGLEKRKYLLYVSRLEPENNAHLFTEAYKNLDTDMPLVIVGDAPYGAPYIQRLHASSDHRIKFLGGVYGEGYRVLKSHAYIYLHGNEVGGTNPALIEAMAMGNCVVATGVGFNRHMIGNAGFWFRHRDQEALLEILRNLLDNPEEVEKHRPLAIERMKQFYNWDDVSACYESLFNRMIGGNASVL